VTRDGRPVAVILDTGVYQRVLDEAEAATDRADLRAAREDDEYVPWAEVKTDLGLT
jgi:hypothetical protein